MVFWLMQLRHCCRKSNLLQHQTLAMMSSEEYPGSPPAPPMAAPSGLLGLPRPQAQQLSPYFNVNPSYVQTPEFIVNQVGCLSNYLILDCL